MVTTRFYLDCRNVSPGAPAPLKLAIFKDRVRSLIPMNVLIHPDKWDPKKQVVADSELQEMLNQRKIVVEAYVFRAETAGEFVGMKSCQVKDKIVAVLFDGEPEPPKPKVELNNFQTRFKAFQDSRPAEGTRDLYNRTWIQIEKFARKEKFNLSSLTFEAVDVKWLKDFDKFLSKTSPAKNARNIHFRNIRAVFNDALDDDVITCYPFRKFKIKGEETEKRSLSVENLRRVFDCKVEKYAEFYQDMFKLSFFLIGINPVDLAKLKEITPDGRIQYRRAKTHKIYSLRVEPEAMEIIKRWRGEKYLLSILDRWKDYRNFSRQLNIALQCMGAKRKGLGGTKGVGMFPDLTAYWARHTWASIASELDVPDAVIAHALGHAPENKTTDIYILRNRKKVDAANRKVIDWVVYGKGGPSFCDLESDNVGAKVDVAHE